MGGSFDQSFLRWINGWPDWLEPFMLFMTNATNYGWVKGALIAMVLAMLIRGPKTRTAAVLALLAFPLANEITDVFKANLAHPRPFQELDWVNVRGNLQSDSMGTASAHSANMAAVAAAFTAGMGRWGWPWIAVALFTGLSRIYVGVHYPSQVLLGWSAGLFAAFVVVSTYRAFVRSKERRASQSNQD